MIRESFAQSTLHQRYEMRRSAMPHYTFVMMGFANVISIETVRGHFNGGHIPIELLFALPLADAQSGATSNVLDVHH